MLNLTRAVANSTSSGSTRVVRCSGTHTASLATNVVANQVCDAESKTPVHKYQHIYRTGVVFTCAQLFHIYVDAKLAQRTKGSPPKGVMGYEAL